MLRRVIDRCGLTGLARRVVLAAAGPTRTVAVDGATATFGQHDFGDYIELNQVDAEEAEVERLRDELAPDDVLLDVGSNLGVHAVFLGLRLDAGTVVAVEPVPETVEKLVANLERNGVDGTVCPVAFSDTTARGTMSVPDSHGSSTLTERGAVTVDRVRGDAYLADHDLPAPTVVKVDVEGHELAALDGLAETLSRPACRLLYCEVHDDGAGASDVRAAVERHGFETERIADLPGERHVLRGERL